MVAPQRACGGVVLLQCFLFSSFSLAAAESLGKDDDDGQRKVTLMEMISLCSSPPTLSTVALHYTATLPISYTANIYVSITTAERVLAVLNRKIGCV